MPTAIAVLSPSARTVHNSGAKTESLGSLFLELELMCRMGCTYFAVRQQDRCWNAFLQCEPCDLLDATVC